jgi:uncharacterized protein YndB with AHSA1/START domain
MIHRISSQSGLPLVLAIVAPGLVHAGERTIRVEKVIPATIDDVWNAWTTSDGVASYAPPKANIELRVGGPYEWYFLPDAPEGSRGSEGCTIVSFVPKRMLSFTWNAPTGIPSLRNAGARTHVVVLFDELAPNRVRVTLSQLITEEGPDWDAYYKYFHSAWPHVLSALHDKMAATLKESTGATGLDAFAPFIGEWTADGTWGDADTGSMRVTYEWALDRKAVVIKSYVNRDGNENMVYQTLCSRHPQSGDISFRSVSVWDVLYEGIAEARPDQTLEYHWFDFAKDETRAWRQTIKCHGDTYDWKVYKQGDAGWVLAKESTYHRATGRTNDAGSPSTK